MMPLFRSTALHMSLTAIATSSLCVSALPTDPARPLIINNSVYAADGRRLRGDHVDVAWSGRALNPATWNEKKDILFNCRRLDGNKPLNEGGRANDESLFRLIDSCVNIASRSGQYVLLLYGGCFTGGEPHQKEFWTMAAPRYKDRTHVIFCLKNEPSLAWVTSSVNNSTYTCSAALANLVRSLAPNTMIWPFSTPDGVFPVIFYAAFDTAHQYLFKTKWDWSNAAVAFHGYAGMDNIDSLHKYYPCVEDEVPDAGDPAYPQNGGYWQNGLMERERVAWNYYQGKRPWDATALKTAAVSGGYAWWIDPVMGVYPDGKVNTRSLSFVVKPGSNLDAQIARVTNEGGAVLPDVAVSVTYKQGTGWLSVQRSGSGNLQMLSNSVSTAQLSPGVFQAVVTVQATSAKPDTASYTVTLDARAAQVFSAIRIEPSSTAVQPSSTRQFRAIAADQYSDSLENQPAITWAAKSGGAVNASGLFTAGPIGGTFSVTAQAAVSGITRQQDALVNITSQFSTLTKVRLYPRSGLAARMVWSVIEGSNSMDGPYTELARITTPPAENQWREIALLTKGNWYRYVRYYNYGSNCNVAELELYFGAQKAVGTPFGSPGSWGNSGNDYRKALDGNTATFFDAPTHDGYAGLDLAEYIVGLREESVKSIDKRQALPKLQGTTMALPEGVSDLRIMNCTGAVVYNKKLSGPGSLDASFLKKGFFVMTLRVKNEAARLVFIRF